MFRSSPPSGRRSYDVYDDRRASSSAENDCAECGPDVRADDTVDATAAASPSGDGQPLRDIEDVEKRVFDELHGMQRDVETHLGMLSGSVAGRGASIFDAVLGAVSEAASSVRDAQGTFSQEFKSTSTSRVVGPDGKVQEKTVTTMTGPDGIATTKSIVRNPDGEETVTVTRGDASDDIVPPFGGDAALLLGPLIGAAMGAWQDVAERQPRLVGGSVDQAANGVDINEVRGIAGAGNRTANPEERPEAEPWRFGRATRRAWNAFWEG